MGNKGGIDRPGQVFTAKVLVAVRSRTLALTHPQLSSLAPLVLPAV